MHSLFGFEAAGDEFCGCEEVNHAIFLAVHLYILDVAIIKLQIIVLTCPAAAKKKRRNYRPGSAR